MYFRSFLSAGSPASAPSTSRLVEAICIRLCDRITQPTKSKLPSGRQEYISRWKTILFEYNSLRERLLNSSTLLDKTGLSLVTINESTLIRYGLISAKSTIFSSFICNQVVQKHHEGAGGADATAGINTP